jgi:hypothetical protein
MLFGGSGITKSTRRQWIWRGVAPQVEIPRLGWIELLVREVFWSMVTLLGQCTTRQRTISVGGNMTNRLRCLIVVLILATACLAQDGLTVQSKGKWPAAEAQKIYVSACSAVQREFGGHRRIAPRVTLVLGDGKNDVWFQEQEIRLTKWNRYAFAQGVVWLAFADLMPLQQRLAIAKRAVNWADATVGVEQLRK